MHESPPFGHKLTTWMSAGIIALLILYPALVYFGLSYFGASWIAAVLIAACLLRLFALRFGRQVPLATAQIAIVCGGGIALAVVSVLRESVNAMLYYPVLVNAAMLLLFAHSLVYPPTIIERIARMQDGDLPERVVIYTRRVTIAWTIFFVCNGGIALYTAVLTSLETWALYNGMVAYILIGLLFGGEFLMRIRLKRKLRE